MTPQPIGLEDARQFWAHPSQHGFGMTERDLTDACTYWADGDVCLAFHSAPWPGVWMVHVGVKPQAWGHAVEPAKRILRAFWEFAEAQRLVAWIDGKNRAAVAFARRCGLTEDGRMTLRGGLIVQLGWGA